MTEGSEIPVGGISQKVRPTGKIRGEINSRVDEFRNTANRFGVDLSGVPKRFIIHQAAAGVRLERKRAEAEENSLNDPLTGLTRKEHYESAFIREFKLWERGTIHGLAVANVDLDEFGLVNKQYGHDIGDAILKGVGEAIRTSVRQTDVTGRVGGEEFEIAMPIDTPTEYADLTERLRVAIAKIPREDKTLTPSIGIAEATKGDTPATLMKRADAAMRLAKKLGRNRTVVSSVSESGVEYHDLSTGKKYSVTMGENGYISEYKELQ